MSIKPNFANEKIEFKPIIDVLELLFGNMAFGNSFVNVTDFRNYTFPYHSPGVLSVSGYRHEDIGGMEWLANSLHPDDNPVFMEYSVKILSYIQTLTIDQKRRTMINHCYRIKHGKTNRYIWIYQQHHLSHVDKNGSIVYSISLLTDVTHLLPNQTSPSWSVTERLANGTTVFHIGSGSNHSSIFRLSKPFFTNREMEVLNLAARGFQTKEIASQLGVGYQTVVTYKKKLIKKTESKNMTEAIAYALNLGFL